LLQADTPEELARRLAIDADGLKQTIHEYNDSAASGAKDAFGRTLPEPLRAPFYGIKVTVALYHTQGGLKVNRRRAGASTRWLDHREPLRRRRRSGRCVRARGWKVICLETASWRLSVSV
jgi:hypothetical protein